MDADRETVEEHVEEIADANDLRAETVELAIDALDAAESSHIAEEPSMAASALYAAALIANDKISARTLARDTNIQPGVVNQPEVVKERALQLIEYLSDREQRDST